MAGFLMRNRAAVGSLTAFAVAFSYVGANALWYQPHAHSSAFFATRPAAFEPADRMAQPADAAVDAAAVETIIRIEREKLAARDTAEPAAAQPASVSAPAPAANGDPVVEEVQRILSGLNLYSGKVDGLTGPQTRSAIEAYRKMVGLSASAEIDDHLLAQLGARPRSATGAPPLPQGSPGTDLIETSSAPPRGDAAENAVVMRIQAGLRAFGNEGIEIDGVVGARTRAAILEFQSLFGLPETGEPDQALYAKMRDIGLTD
ncbi:MAG TPA: peptidoglycan-binding domain-containing protein [Aquamicrobium sp.]|nr:peptidoglycan-binding domain-containing protein [Aquamicrobium sp.]